MWVSKSSPLSSTLSSKSKQESIIFPTIASHVAWKYFVFLSPSANHNWFEHCLHMISSLNNSLANLDLQEALDTKLADDPIVYEAHEKSQLMEKELAKS